jgi:hypothetical protein
MAGGVSVNKLHSIFCHLVNRGRFIKTASITPDIAPTQIINQKEYDVGFLDLSLNGTEEKKSWNEK